MAPNVSAATTTRTINPVLRGSRSTTTIPTPILTLTARHSTVTEGDSLDLVATAVNANNKTITTQVAQLQRATHGTWVTIGSQRLSGAGTARFVFQVWQPHSFRVILRAITSHGVRLYNPSASARVTVLTKPVPTPVAKLYTNTAALGRAIVREAAKHAGARYVFGTAGPTVFDCSGLTLFVFHKFGIELPHKANIQKTYGTPVSRENARPGDLIFFLTPSAYAHHVAIYTGRGMMWEAPHTGSYVRHVRIWSNKIQFRRVTR